MFRLFVTTIVAFSLHEKLTKFHNQKNYENGFKEMAIANDNINAWSESVHTVDVDNDNDFDIFFTTQFGVPNLLFINDGWKIFTRFSRRSD